MTCLMTAVFVCQLISPFLLLQEGFDADKTAQLLEKANSFSSSLEDNLALIKAGADPNGKDKDGYPVIANASYNGNDEMVKALIASKADIDAQSPKGASALMMACHKGKWTIVPLLLEGGAQVDLTDVDGWTALMWAAKAGSWSVCEPLIKAGANVNAKGKDDWSPVLLAIRNGKGSVLEKLFAAGAKLDAKTPKNVPAAILAVIGGDSEIVRAVIEKTGQPDAVDKDGWTPLMVAAKYGDAEIVMDLIRAGADTALKNKEGKTALQIAKEGQFEETIALLGGDFKKRQPSGGVTLEIPCEPLDGGVKANVKIEEDQLVFSAYYKKTLATYLGGFEKGAKKVSAGMSFHIDRDLDKKTGRTKEWGVHEKEIGADLEISWSEIRTSVRDEQSGAYLSRQYMDASLEAFGEGQPTQKIEECYPRSERDLNVVRVPVPLEVLELTKGQKVRLIVKAGFCDPVEKTLTLE